VDANQAGADEILAAAARIAGLASVGAEVIRNGSNVMYELPNKVVARIGRVGCAETARKEVAVSRWLTDAGLPVVQAVTDLPQPVIVDERPITWWKLLPKHRPGTPGELGRILRRLHALPVPDELRLPDFDPFGDLERRLGTATGVDETDHAWLADHVKQLRAKYQKLRQSSERSVIHGDAWQGNVAVVESGETILLDLEDVALGNPDNDLISIAVDRTDFARLTDEDYKSFVTAYGGRDVVDTPGYRTLADIRELRWVTFVLGKVGGSAQAAREARHRIACLRGDVPRPWTWDAF
jgi:hypothetical protein